MSRFAGRGLDKAWFAFCVLHIPITLFIDCQSLYPTSWLANTPFPALVQWYIEYTRDPILVGANGADPSWAWLRSFIKLEAFFQLPVMFLGAYCLWKNDKRVYPLLLAYGASTTTTLIPVLQHLFTVDASPPFTSAEFLNLLAAYLPYLFVPLTMTVDMGWRLTKIVSEANVRKRV